MYLLLDNNLGDKQRPRIMVRSTQTTALLKTHSKRIDKLATSFVALRALLCLVFCLALPSDAQPAKSEAPASKQKIKTAIILPRSTGATEIIYNEVLTGISAHPTLDISIITLEPGTTAALVDEQIKTMNSKLVIAVGNISYRLAKTLTTDSLIIAGGISGKPNGIPTLSLTGDPGPTLRELKRVAPHVKDVRLVYNDNVNGWWYRRAQAVAKEYEINIIGYEASDIKDGVKLYEKLLDEASPNNSAVWIPLRSVVPSKTILPLLLDRAWSKKLAVVSNNPSHTKLGGLIALYPHHKKMGTQLAQFAIDHYNGVETARIVGTDSLRIAINLRTSSHIGLRLSAKDRASFDKVYPTKR